MHRSSFQWADACRPQRARLFSVKRYPLWIVLLAVVPLGSGCNSADPDASGVQVELTLEPSPPIIGDAELNLKLSDTDGIPLEGAEVRVEGNMNHAGMKPSFADLREVEPGRYTGTLEFTMGGDWFLLITAKTPDGKRVERKIDVQGVKAK